MNRHICFLAAGLILMLRPPAANAQYPYPYPFTGDILVDQWSGPPVDFAGNAGTASSLYPSNYVNGVTACSATYAPPWESNCPSDLTYSPAAGTGGTQAFGVFYQTDPQQEGWVLVPVLSADWDWECNCLVYYWDVELVWGVAPASSWGRVAAHIRWGNVQVALTGVPGSRALSTLSLKAAGSLGNIYPQYNCNPSLFYGLGSSKPCDPTQKDAFLVPRGGLTPSTAGVGYEDKVIVPNPSCPAVYVRTGTTPDKDHGCFTFDGLDFYSNIPQAYQDTTRFDIGSPYVAGVGTTSPHLLLEGVDYWWTIDFEASGYQPLIGEQVRHTANITMYDSGYPCTPGSAPLCQFTVDQTNIAPIATMTRVQ